MKIKLFLLIVILLGMFFILYQVLLKDKSAAVSQQEAEELALDLYSGEIIKTEMDKNKNHYIITIENEKGIYRLTVSGVEEKVSNVKRIKKKQSILTQEEAKGKIEQEFNGKVLEINPSKKKKAHAEALVKKGQKKYRITFDLKKRELVSTIELKKNKDDLQSNPANKDTTTTEKQIKAIALKKMDGNGNVSDITKMNSKNGVVYKVTIENKSEDVHVYIQEATKKVTSVSRFTKELETDDDDDIDDDTEDDDTDDDNDEADED
ncbi:hypothetical protein KK120_20990 [Virgibacillus dakarensis]|nr:hypothetical protein [Virgibacillus dakarensis]